MLGPERKFALLRPWKLYKIEFYLHRLKYGNIDGTASFFKVRISLFGTKQSRVKCFEHKREDCVGSNPFLPTSFSHLYLMSSKRGNLNKKIFICQIKEK